MAQKKPSEGKSRALNNDREIAISAFVQAILDGHRQADAYRMSHPSCKSTNDNAVRVRACEFAKHPDVQEALAAARRELLERHANFRDHLVEMLTEEIDTCYRDNHTLAPVMKQVEVATRVLGMDKQIVKVDGDVGGFDRESVAANIQFLVDKAKGSKS